jgi:hypothetical protein
MVFNRAAGTAARVQCGGCGAKLVDDTPAPPKAPPPRPLPDVPPGSVWRPTPEGRGGGGRAVAFLLAVLLFCGAGYWSLESYRKVTGWDRAQGNVVGLRIESPTRVFARVQFSAANGQPYRFEEACTWDARVGETVEVVYQAADPNEAKIEDEVQAVVGPIIPWVGPVFLALLGFVCLSWWRLSL